MNPRTELIHPKSHELPTGLNPLIDLSVSQGVNLNGDSNRGKDLHLVDVTVRYGSGDRQVTPIENFSMYAPFGRITALVGRSGSGKTSLLSCVAATLRPQTGCIWLGGTDVVTLAGAALDSYRRTSVGVVHQSYNLIPSLSALENVMVPMRLAGLPKQQATARARELLDQLGLLAARSSLPHQLSGGQQQRVAVARALANDPALIIADEPTAHLDGGTVEDVSTLLRSLANDGHTVVLSTHDDRLLGAADQVIALGNSTASASPMRKSVA
jgi:putative ABC transport system ATP-binding protein